MLTAGVSELRRAFYVHRRNAEQGHDSSHALLLFYAVECGLKAALLQRRRCRTTEQLDPSWLREHGHDLMRWVKELGLPASIASIKAARIRLERGGASPIHRAHEAWRYGVRILKEDEEMLTRWLREISGWVKEAL